MTFAGAWRSNEMNHFVSVNEVECGEGGDAIAVERRLEGEVEAGQRLDRGQSGHLQRRLDAPALADRQLLGEQRFDRLDGAELAAFGAAQALDDALAELDQQEVEQREAARRKRVVFLEAAVEQHTLRRDANAVAVRVEMLVALDSVRAACFTI